MNVGELISILRNYHDATPVLVQGYEDGYDDLTHKLVRVEGPSKHAPWWSGRYQENLTSGREAIILEAER